MKPSCAHVHPAAFFFLLHPPYLTALPPSSCQVYLDTDNEVESYIRRTVEATKHVCCNAGGTFKLWLTSPERRDAQGFECRFYLNGEAPNPKLFNLASTSIACARWSRAALSPEELASEAYQQFDVLILGTIREQV